METSQNVARIELGCSAGSYCHHNSLLFVDRGKVSLEGLCIERNPAGREYDGFFADSSGRFYHSRQCFIDVCEED